MSEEINQASDLADLRDELTIGGPSPVYDQLARERGISPAGEPYAEKPRQLPPSLENLQEVIRQSLKELTETDSEN